MKHRLILVGLAAASLLAPPRIALAQNASPALQVSASYASRDKAAENAGRIDLNLGVPDASKRYSARVLFPAATINGQAARVILDTGAQGSTITDRGAHHFFFKTTPANIESIIKFGNLTPSLSEPVQMTIGSLSFKVQFLVSLDGVDDDFHAIIGWPEIRNNEILVFNSTLHTVSRGEQLPTETANWLKLKIHPEKALMLDSTLPDGKTISILVDTGSAYGVALSPEQWKTWRAAHLQAPVRQTSYYMPGAGDVATEEVWANEITLGTLTLTDVPIRVANNFEISLADNFAGSLGLYAIERMQLVVNGKNGVAYLKANPPPGLPYPGFDRPTQAKNENTEDKQRDWMVQNNVRVTYINILAESGKFKAAITDYDGSITDFTTAIRLDNKNASLYSDRATTKYMKKDFNGAVVDITQAIALDPKNAVFYTNRASAEFAKKDYGVAIADYSQAIALDPKKTKLYLYRAAAKAQTKDTDGAIADYTTALQLDGKNVSIYADRASVKYQKSDFDGAIADYTLAIVLEPKNKVLFINRGLVAFTKKDFDAAIADFDFVLKLDPENAPASQFRAKAELARLEANVPARK